MIRIEYEKFVHYILNKNTSGMRRVIGRFREVGLKGLNTEELDVLMIESDAKKSYDAVVAYFNHTRTDNEQERIPVSAKWAKPKEVEDASYL